jgi:proteic killer suppression protein
LIRIRYNLIYDPVLQGQGNGTDLAGPGEPAFPQEYQDRALRKLRQLDASRSLDDLRNPPGNRLELLGGNRTGQMSIRINDQWRICFAWVEGDAIYVEIVDYHR